MNKKINYKVILIWSAVFLWMIMIFCFSAQNADESSDTSGGFAKLLAKIIYNNFDTVNLPEQEIIINKCQFIVRKAAHFSVYNVLGILTFAAVHISGLKFPLVKAPVICLAYAASDEIHQYFVPGRSCELRDVCIDFSGSVTGIILACLVLLIAVKMRKGKIK
ncbi:VanZ family protein [Porcipelethomonas sp.]|uniref:VanZ family protein n=1 Tax=Porcipelethomonas sp. TaxID=2981675 RepID=UPI003EF9F151